MYENKWIFQGKVIKIIDGQTIVVWLDLGFELWKKVTVRFNRIRAKDYTFRDPKGPAGKFPDNDAKESTLFLENNLKGKKVVCQITKQPGYNGFDKYFAEIFGSKDEVLLAIYSHMVSDPLYLSAYPIGHLIQFHLEQYLHLLFG